MLSKITYEILIVFLIGHYAFRMGEDFAHIWLMICKRLGWAAHSGTGWGERFWRSVIIVLVACITIAPILYYGLECSARILAA